MIRVVYRDFNKSPAELTVQPVYYPDGTMKINLPLNGQQNGSPVRIIWKYETEAELLRLIYVTKHIHAQYQCEIELFLPYLPNARMDRVHAKDEVFTLKYFCEIINSLEFSRVTVLDVHSSVGAALLDRVTVQQPENYFLEAKHVCKFSAAKDCVFFPDEGSCKRYADLCKGFAHIAFGIKKRDWNTGKILGLDVVGEIPQGAKILIVDDICAYGGTVYHSAKKLKEMGAGEIYVFFSHCENSIAQGELLKGDLIAGIYTTDSICTLDPKDYPKLYIMHAV